MSMRSNTMRKPTLVAKSALLAKVKKENKNLKIEEKSSSENSFGTLLDKAKDKIKDAYSGENLLEAPEEGEDDFPFKTLPPKKSFILNEDTIIVNLGMVDNLQITYIAITPSTEEQEVMT